MKKILHSTIGILLCLVAFHLKAQPQYLASSEGTSALRLYHVELIIFKNLADSNEQPLNTAQTSPLSLTHAIELNQLGVSYHLLPANDFKLNREAHLLAQQSNYQILLHIAWLQPLNAPYHTAPIHIYGGENFDDHGNNVWQINGTLKLSMDNYINTTAHLFFTNSNLHTFQIKEYRRIKLNELNYFDNPYFGMLIKIIPEKLAFQQSAA